VDNIVLRQANKQCEADLLFLDFVKEGMTRKELEANIARRPELWKRYAEWLTKLPQERREENEETDVG
jgi:hypothetical protein